MTVVVKEIANALEIGARRVQQRAALEAWPFTAMKWRGGEAHIYNEATLPGDVQCALAALRERRETQRCIAQNTANAKRTEKVRAAQAQFDNAKGARKETAERRVAALLRVDELREKDVTLNLETARAQVAAETGCSVSVLQRWGRKVRGFAKPHWPALLLPEERGKPMRVEIHPDAWAEFKRDYLRLEKPNVESCYRRLRRSAPNEWRPLPSLRTVKRRVNELSATTRTLLREGEEAMMRMGPKIERSRAELAAMERVNADGHTFDVAVKFPDGSIGRPVLVGWQDIASGKLLAYRVGKSETAELVRLSFCDMVKAYGIPQHAYLDNGRAFASKQNTGGMATRYRFKVRAEDPEGALTRAGVNVHWVTPYNGKAKPIERAWRDLADDVAKRPEFAGAYLGNSPDNKPENYGSRAVDYAEFIRVLDDGVREHNARDGRRGGVCAGRSFDATFVALYAESTVTKATKTQLATMLLATEAVTVRKGTGAIHLADNVYWSESLAEHQGKKVHAHFDPKSLHTGVHVFLPDRTYLGFVPCTYKTGFDTKEKASEAIKAKNRFRKAVKAKAAAELAWRTAAQPHAMPAIPEPVMPEAKVIKLHRPKRKMASSTTALPSGEVSFTVGLFTSMVPLKRSRL
ncbi:MAG: Mu transposase C-terminal domain-containing protein [Rhodanobacter sp.]|jgi:hypothetical protein|nr:Mu transposase C-terminal domain-containing protein [Rhodanobacter sp.]